MPNPNVPVAETPERGVPEEEPKQAPQALPAWDDLTGQQQADRTELVRSGFLKAYEQFRPFFEALGVKISENPYMEAGIGTYGNGRMELWFGPQKLAQMFNEYGQRGGEIPSYHTILQHELIHAAWTHVQRERWEASGRNGSFRDFRRAEAGAISNNIAKARIEALQSGDYKLANAINKGAGGGLFLYTEGINFGRNAPRSIFRQNRRYHFEIAHSSQVLCVPGVVMVTTINSAVIA
jgi:hypothetical protein